MVTVSAPMGTVQLVEHTELLVKERALWQHLLVLKIGARPRHPHNKVLGTLALIDDVVPIPRTHLSALHARLALRPCKTLVSMRVNRSILCRKRSHIVGNPKTHKAFDFLGLFLKEWIKLPLTRDDGAQLLEMQLVGDTSIVARFQSTQKALLIKRLHHLLISGIICRKRSKQLLYIFRKLIIRARTVYQIVFCISLRLSWIVPFRHPSIHNQPLAAKKRLVRLGSIFPHQSLQQRKIIVVAVVFFFLAKRQRLSISVSKDAREQICRIGRSKGGEERCALVGTYHLELFDFFVVSK